jgi:hypothetical protein
VLAIFFEPHGAQTSNSEPRENLQLQRSCH